MISEFPVSSPSPPRIEIVRPSAVRTISRYRYFLNNAASIDCLVLLLFPSLCLSLSLGLRQVNRPRAPVRATSLPDPSSSIRDYSLVQSAHLSAHPFVRTQSLAHAWHKNAETTQVTLPSRSSIDRERKQTDPVVDPESRRSARLTRESN